MNDRDKPRIKLISTGGTITRSTSDRLDLVEYGDQAARLDVDALVGRVPEVHTLAQIETMQMDRWILTINAEDWVKLAVTVNSVLEADPGLTGAVIVHGTSFMEETAYFLHLTLKTEKPIVLTGAQRPLGAVGEDGTANLTSAVRTACAPSARGLGVLVCMNEEIHSARDVTKGSNYRVHAFRSRDLGMLGYADSDGEVVIYRRPTRRHTANSEFDMGEASALPRVDVVYVHANGDGAVVEALIDLGTQGIVTAGAPPGFTSPAMSDALVQATAKGIVVVESSRAGSGRTVRTNERQRRRFIAADNLPPHKARILLMLALSKTTSYDEIQRMFLEY